MEFYSPNEWLHVNAPGEIVEAHVNMVLFKTGQYLEKESIPVQKKWFPGDSQSFFRYCSYNALPMPVHFSLACICMFKVLKPKYIAKVPEQRYLHFKFIHLVMLL